MKPSLYVLQLRFQLPFTRDNYSKINMLHIYILVMIYIHKQELLFVDWKNLNQRYYTLYFVLHLLFLISTLL